MKMKKILSITPLLFMLMSCTDVGVSSTSSSIIDSINVDTKKDYFDYSYDEEKAVKIELKDNQSSASNKSVSIVDNKITITQVGTYVISGSISDGQVIINCSNEITGVHIILDGASITCSNSSPLYIKKCKGQTMITLKDGTTSTLVDGSDYVFDNEDEPNATLFSKDDLIINGKGSLHIKANYADGIKCKDSLYIVGGNYEIESIDDGIIGKDLLSISDGVFNIVSGGDALKSSDTDKGLVNITGGEFTINATADGIQSETLVQISGGSFNITTGGGSINSSTSSSFSWGNWGGGNFNPDSIKNKGNRMNKEPQNGETDKKDKDFSKFPSQFNPNGEFNSDDIPSKPDDAFDPSSINKDEFNKDEIPTKPDDAFDPSSNNNDGKQIPNDNSIGNEALEEQGTVATSDSAKGIKGNTGIIISGGYFVLDTSDDAIHSNGDVLISNGNITIESGDDGIHADNSLIINDGEISVNKSYEGLEAVNLVINNGNISVTSNDDGLNAAGGNDASGINRKGFTGFGQSDGISNIAINGGKIYVNASGDGIDSNNTITMSGGTLIIDGPSSSANGAIDYETSFIVTGGTVIAIGASGMALSHSNESSVYGFSYTLSSSLEKDKILKIVDSSGKEIISLTPTKSYNSIVCASDEFKNGSKYSVVIDDENMQEVTISGIITKIGNSSGGFFR